MTLKFGECVVYYMMINIMKYMFSPETHHSSWGGKNTWNHTTCPMPAMCGHRPQGKHPE
jgi:hypothetical protein